MNQPTCQNCLWFVQHYVNLGFRFVETSSGLCCRARGKLRKCTDPVCKHFAEKKKLTE